MKRFIATTLSVIYLLSLPIIFGNLDLALAQATPATMSMTWAADGTGTAIPLGSDKEFKVNINVNTGGLASEGFDIAIDYSSTEVTYKAGSLDYTTFYNGQTVPSNGEVDSSTSGKLKFGRQGAAKTASDVVASLIFVAVNVPGSATLSTNSYITGATGDNVSVYDSPGLGTPRDLLSKKPDAVTFTFTAAVLTPDITDLSDHDGALAGGESVTITGTNFGATKGTGSVKFGAATATVSTWADTSISVTTPSATIAGLVYVVVTAGNGLSSSSTDLQADYTYLSGGTTPDITGLNPANGPAGGGTSVIISGTNFGATQGTGTVKFGTLNATSITSWSATSIMAVAPAGTAGSTVYVVVTNSSGYSSSNGDLQAAYSYDSVLSTDPVISYLSPNFGRADTDVVVTIVGTNFLPTGTTRNTVYFNTYPAVVSDWTDTQIKVTAPRLGAISGDVTYTVRVTRSDGKFATASYTYLAPGSTGGADGTTTPTGMPISVWVGLISLNTGLAFWAKRKFI